MESGGEETRAHRSEIDDVDLRYLERASSIAQAGWGHVHPNPVVGCVLVRDGEIVGEGHHERYGGPHAEAVALERAGDGARGSTAYVTLEPCDHEGQTPPCSKALIRAGVARVIYGANDPGTASGGGAATLRAAAVEVVGPIWSRGRALAENPAFHHLAGHETPYVALKLAATLDARIADVPGQPTRITGREAEHEVHRLRTGFDAVLVGAGTVRADDPRLTPRLAPSGRVAAARIVLDSAASLSGDAALFDDIETHALHVFCLEDTAPSAIERLESDGARVHPVRAASFERAGERTRAAWPDTEDPTRGVDLESVLEVCWGLGLRSILSEGGARLAGRLLHEERVHRIYYFVAPHTLGPGALDAFPGGGVRPGRFDVHVEPRRFGRDTLIVMDRNPDGAP